MRWLLGIVLAFWAIGDSLPDNWRIGFMLGSIICLVGAAIGDELQEIKKAIQDKK